MSGKIYMVSVVRDFLMYGKCIKDNPRCRDAVLVPIDNVRENRPVTVCYNAFLDSLGEGDAWIVFCHEDWMPECDLESLLDSLDKDVLWGPVGVRVHEGRRADFIAKYGRVRQCSKDGSSPRIIRGLGRSALVDSFDCQCLIVHSSLCRRYSLRFDTALDFHLYVEDFCANAWEKYGIRSRTVRLDCTHFSGGQLSDGFFKALSYLSEKYSSAHKRYGSIVGGKVTFGAGKGKPLHTLSLSPLSILRYLLSKLF